MAYKFEVLRDGKVIFCTRFPACAPNAETRKQLKAAGYKIREVQADGVQEQQ